jgi:stress-induced morphogen
MSSVAKLIARNVGKIELNPLMGRRWISSERQLSKGEDELVQILKQNFPDANKIDVVDISGGCGSMYEVYLETKQFKSLRTVKQHQLVNDALKDKVKAMHGIRIFTSAPEV